jgi:hypothetical protein
MSGSDDEHKAILDELSKYEDLVIVDYQALYPSILKSMIKLAIVGSRYFKDWGRFLQFMEEWKREVSGGREPDIIISGGARGVDSLAERYAREILGIEPVVFYPKSYEKYGNDGYLMRNTEIVEACTHVLALPSRTGSGTQDTMRKADIAGKNLFDRYVD